MTAAHSLRPLETKSADNDNDPLVEVKTALAGLADDVATKTAPVAELKAKIDELEKKLNRPAVHLNTKHGTTDEEKAFEGYLRGQVSVDEIKALTITAPGTGGAIAPETYATSVIEKVIEFSPVRSVANVVSIGSSMLKLPRLVDEVEPTEVGETGTRTEDEPSFEQIDLEPFEMATIVPVSRQLVEDNNVNLSGFMAAHLGRKFGQKEGNWFVAGNGTGKARGILNGTDVPAFESENTAITADDLIDVFYGVKSAYSARGAWMMNRASMSAVRKLKDLDGNYLWQPAISADAPPTLLGRPVYEAVDMPSPAAGATPIAFGDFAAGYTIVDRVGLEIQVDNLTGWSSGIVKWLARRRVGGRVVLPEALIKMTLAAA